MLRINIPRRSKALLALVVFALGCLAACRPEVPAKYIEHMTLAQDASVRGEHSEAAAQWEQASQHADLAHVRDEAIYRQATNLERAGKHDASVAILTKLSTTPGSRQERAAYDLATQALLADPGDEGKQLERTLLRFPGSGVARGALDRWLRKLTPEDRLLVLERLAPQIKEPTLAERILLQQARTLELLGRLPEALGLYSTLAQRYPYPAGQYWDEALLHKSQLQARMGQRQRAMETLTAMLTFRETATIVGTYERRYAIATLMLAQLYAPDNWRKAHALLQNFPHTSPTSRELDDALWAAALLARDNGDTELACADIEILRQVEPQSRYAGCGALVCPALGTEPSCRTYVGEDRANFDTVIERSAAPYSGVNEHDRPLERQ